MQRHCSESGAAIGSSFAKLLRSDGKTRMSGTACSFRYRAKVVSKHVPNGGGNIGKKLHNALSLKSCHSLLQKTIVGVTVSAKVRNLCEAWHAVPCITHQRREEIHTRLAMFAIDMQCFYLKDEGNSRLFASSKTGR